MPDQRRHVCLHYHITWLASKRNGNGSTKLSDDMLRYFKASVLCIALVFQCAPASAVPLESISPQGEGVGCTYKDVFNHKIRVTKDGMDTTPSMSCTIVSITNSKIDDTLAVSLAKRLRYMDNLEALYLHFNSIGDDGMIALATEMRNLKLNLYNLNLRSNAFGDAGALALSKALNGMSRLMYLNIGKNKISNEGIIAISKSIKKKQLQELHVDHNQFDDAAVNQIVKNLMFIQRPKLRKFILHAKIVSESTCLQIASFIAKTAKKIEHLDISHMKISTKCAAVLSLAFKKSVSISHLYMRECNLNGKILDIFRKTNGVMLSTLVELDISENFFKERATLLKFAKSMMRFSRAKVDIRSFSVSNILKILLPYLFGYDVLISGYLFKCTEDPDRDNSMCDELDAMIVAMDAEEL